MNLQDRPINNGRKALVKHILNGVQMALSYLDSGSPGKPVPRPFVGGPITGFHSSPKLEDRVFILNEARAYPIAAVSVTDHPERMAPLPAGSSAAYGVIDLYGSPLRGALDGYNPCALEFGGKEGAAISDAINAALQAAVTGTVKIVSIPPGTFIIDKGITIPDGIWLRGAGQGVTFLSIQTDYHIYPSPFVNDGAGSYMKLSDVTILTAPGVLADTLISSRAATTIVSNVYTSGGLVAIAIDNGIMTRISDCTFSLTAGQALDISQTIAPTKPTSTIISNCDLIDVGTEPGNVGIKLGGVPDITAGATLTGVSIIGCVVTAMLTPLLIYSISLRGTDGIAIIGCQFAGSFTASHPILFNPYVTNTYLIANTPPGND